MRAQRDACTFKSGANVLDTLGVTDAERAAIPITHVIVMMKENRSFDHIFGQLYKNGQPDVEPAPDPFTNPDANGAAVASFHQTNTCVKTDPGHQWANMHSQVNGGAMDGFVKNGAALGNDGHFVMGYYDGTELPFYYWLANTYAIADHHFPSVLSGTWPNRDYLVLGTSVGVKSTGAGTPPTTTPSIFSQLDSVNVTWGVYTDGFPLESSLGWARTHKGVGTFAEFTTLLQNGRLPQVTFVDSVENKQDEHPPADMQVGEAWTKSVYDAAIASPLWPHLAIIFTYDEGGGYADHVPPPNGCVASDTETAFFELGIRVPLIAISPYARRHYVSHAAHEHTSILRFIQTIHGLPALTNRDANSDALLDMFDFSCANTSGGGAPAAGQGACLP
jgi:phospholipase C